jgi:hypothetical protein
LFWFFASRASRRRLARGRRREASSYDVSSFDDHGWSTGTASRKESSSNKQKSRRCGSRRGHRRRLDDVAIEAARARDAAREPRRAGVALHAQNAKVFFSLFFFPLPKRRVVAFASLSGALNERRR